MSGVFFVVNALADFDFGELLERHLGGTACAVGTTLPPQPEQYDLVVLWSYRKILPVQPAQRRIVLFHSSPLPQGRGFAPIYHAIADGLERYTISAIFAAPEVDAGELIARASFAMRPEYVAADLRRWDSELSIRLLAELLRRAQEGTLASRPQQGEPSWWPRRRPADNRIDTGLPFGRLVAHLRACEPAHPAWFDHEGVRYLVTVQPERAARFPDDVEFEFLDPA